MTTGKLDSCRVALVTRAERGIAAAISEMFGGSGIQHRDGRQRPRRNRRALRPADARAGAQDRLPPGQHWPPDDCQRVVHEGIEGHGSIGILVDNADVTVDKPVPEMGIDDWQAVLRAKLSGAAIKMSHWLARMAGKQAPLGRFVFLGVAHENQFPVSAAPAAQCTHAA